MRLSFVLAVIAAFRSTVSIPVADSKCPSFCNLGACCPGYECKLLAVPDGFVHICELPT
ncbi:uncharacterized protein BJ212DRAFT_1332737, partial [Suillus subaureus]